MEFQTGGVGSRGIAFVIDAVIYFAALSVVTAAIAIVMEGGGLPSWVGIAIIIVVWFLILMGYPVAFETLRGGRTPGKAAMGLRVVTQEGGPVGFRHAFIRAALGFLDFWISSGAVAVISTLLTAQNQRLGDLAAGTLVVRERGGRTPPRTAAFPPLEGLESYTRMLDVSALRHREYAPVRAFLLRARSLQPARRRAIAERFAEEVASRVRPPAAPRPISAEEFLWCVASAYQARHASADRQGAPSGTQQAAAPLPAEVTTAAVDEREQPAPLAPDGGAAAQASHPSEAAVSGDEPPPPPARGGFVPPA